MSKGLSKEELIKILEEPFLKQLDSPLDNHIGYCIKESHFKIRDRVHTEKFYHIKPFFQNSIYADSLAEIFAEEIIAKINKEKKAKFSNITLVGYGMYSELFLNSVEEKLKSKQNVNVNHFIAKDEEDKITFLPEKSFETFIKSEKFPNNKIIIIIPISDTSSIAKKLKKEIQKLSDKFKDGNKLFILYNVISTYEKDDEELENPIITLEANRHDLKDCPLCYGKDNKALLDTNDSSFAPSLIFGNPKGKNIIYKKEKWEEVKSNISFDDLQFLSPNIAIDYRSVSRNNNYRIYSVDPYKFIENNENIKNSKGQGQVTSWLQEKVSPHFEINGKIIIVAPNHESNAKFINLINDNVFSSNATVICYENGVDYPENFILLHSKFFEGNPKIFYVDDSLITGKHFFEIFDLVRSITGNPEPFAASIFLTDEATPFIHDRVVRWSKLHFAFATINTPPTINLHGRSQLEYEQKRYESLQENVLHDTLRKYFLDKADKLDSKKIKNEEEPSKNIKHLKMFEATHKIYDYFTKYENIPNLTKPEVRKQFVNFKLKHNIKGIDEEDIEEKALLKVLSQHPFINYKWLRERTFEWHKQMLGEILKEDSIPDTKAFKINNDYENFKNFKFLLRRAVFLDNYQVLKPDFLKILLIWFCKIDEKNKISNLEEESLKLETEILELEENPSRNEQLIFQKKEIKNKINNLRNFPIFALSSYLEMIQKNSWIAVKLMENIKTLEEKECLINELCCRSWNRFYRMLQIETAIVVDDYVKMIEKEYAYEWRGMYKYTLNTKYNESKKDRIANSEFVTHNLYIRDFFKTNKEKLIDNNNKYEIIKALLKENLPNDWYENAKKEKTTPFENYLWIKQMIFNDTNKNSYFPKNINYQTKINGILEKMKDFFSNGKIQAFFIVTDNKQNPDVLYDKENVLHDLEDEHNPHKDIMTKLTKDEKLNSEEESKLNKLKYSVIFKFLYGTPSVEDSAKKTIIEYEKNNKDKWKDCYDEDDISMTFLANNSYLLLIRLSSLNEEENFVTSGMLGFYGEDSLYSKKENILPKQLLMLLRNDMNEFIKKHHKNDEFATLRAIEIMERSVFLAGHGKETMKRLAEEDGIFKSIENTMETLQHFYAIEDLRMEENIDKNNLKNIFMPPEIKKSNNQMLEKTIEEYIRKIYESKSVENKVEITTMDNSRQNEKAHALYKVEVDIKYDHRFSEHILLFIIFELIINAKKNRWHCIENTFKNESCKNYIKVKITKENKKDDLIIEVKTTGTEVEENIIDAINNGRPIKENSQKEGIYLINTILKDFNKENKIEMKSELNEDPIHNNECEHKCLCELYKNTTTITIKRTKNERN